MFDTALAHTNIDRQIAALQALHGAVETPEYHVIVDVLTFWVKERPFENRIIVTGVGKNASIAAKVSETMASLGIPSFYLNTAHTGHGDYGFIGPNDVIIHISRSGTTREMLETIKHVKLIRPNVNQILIHCRPTKPLNEDVNLELCIGAVQEGDEHGLAPTASTTALLCVLDCIAVQVSHNAGFQRMDFLKLHPDGALGALLKAEQTAQALNAFDPARHGGEMGLDTDLSRDAARYRWLFDDPAVQAFKEAVETGGPLPCTRTELLHEVLGFVTSKEAVDAAVDAAMREDEWSAVPGAPIDDPAIAALINDTPEAVRAKALDQSGVVQFSYGPTTGAA